MKIASPEWAKSVRGQQSVCCYGESGRSSVRWQQTTGVVGGRDATGSNERNTERSETWRGMSL